MSGNYTVISTFAGCGGSSLGYKWAGFKELLAIDFDKNSVETFRLNFPEVPCWQRDITEVKANEILEFCNIKVGELDILDGSPPCQGFSTAGKRQVTDLRNDLFKSFVYLIQELQPKIFVMENVSGMVKGKMKGKFKEIILSLKALNYQVKYKLLNAKYYEVPQSRQRLFFIGIRNDLNLEPVFPEGNNKVITAGEALKNLRELGEVKYPKGDIDKYYYQIKIGSDLAEIFEKKFNKRTYFNIKKINPNNPSNTLTKLFSEAIAGLLHWNEKRYLTINELKILCSFPEEFKMTGNFKEQWARLGNSVMPKQMYHIAKTLKEKILDEIYT
jgi:DNA (cytosine-5)-methyltransferase 1